jgi:hypothetical protein
MGQVDIIAWMEEHPGWKTIAVLSIETGRDPANLRKLLAKMHRNQDVERMKTGFQGRAYMYRVLGGKR